MPRCVSCGESCDLARSDLCAACAYAAAPEVPGPTDDALDQDDAGPLASWSGHDWYRDLGGEAGHE